MSTDIKTVNITNTLKDIESIFQEHNIHHIPVVSGDQLIGMISRSDLLRISYAAEVSDAKVNSAIYDVLSIDQVMTKELTTVNEDDLIKDVADIFSNNSFHALPVMKNGSVAGIVTTTDVIKYLVDQF